MQLYLKLVQLLHYLACFTDFITEAPAQELATVKEKANWLEYILKQEKSTNIELVKKINSCRKALQEVQEKIGR